MARAAAQLVRIQVALPEEIVEAYEKLATSDRTAEQIIAARLKACVGHTASRGIYFNDAERNELEMLLGEGIFNNAEEVLNALRLRYNVVIGGESIHIDPTVYSFLKDRAAELAVPMRDLIVEACKNGLNDSVFGAH